MTPNNAVARGEIGDEFAELGTVPAILAKRVALTPAAPAHFTQDALGTWCPTTWQTFAALKDNVAGGFRGIGLEKGDRIALLAATSQDWEICQMAAFELGATVIGIDPYYPAAQTNELLCELAPALLVVGDAAQLARVRDEVRARMRVVIMSDVPADNHDVVGLAALKHAPPSDSLKASDTLVRGQDPAIVVFSSGTTGVPKPIVYTHEQVSLACRAILEAFDDIEAGSNLVCWLPLANLFQRIINYCCMIKGAATYIVTDPRMVMQCLPIANPPVFIAVPRFCERLHKGIEEKIAALPAPVAAFMRSGLAASVRARKLRAEGGVVPIATALMAVIARHTALKRLRGILGSRIKYIVSGSAPCPVWLLDFFAGMGVPILEAYGQSENIVPIALNRPSDFRFGTVGHPLRHNQVRVSEAGEVQVKGAGVFHPDLAENRARQPLTADGFLATGDRGEFIEGGYLKLNGRLSEVFKTANGRWVSPGEIEAVLQRIPYVEQTAVLSRGGGTIVAIMVVSGRIPVMPRAASAGAAGADFSDPATQDAIRADVVRELSAYPLGGWPQAVLVTREAFSVDGGELTTNLKLRRTVIGTKYREALDTVCEEVQAAGLPHAPGTSLLVRAL